MRGQQERSGSLFSYVSIEERIPASHPLRRIRKLADQALDRLNPTFCKLYAAEGRPSVPPEQLLLASLLQAFYGIRSERLLLEQLHYNLLFRWFVGLSPDDPIWHPTTFTKNRERLLNDDVMGRFLEKLMGAPEVKPLLSDEHFSVDGTLLQAWASHALLERIDEEDDPPPPPSGSGEGFGAPKPGKKRAKGDFRGIKLSNKTHRSGSDPDALLCRKSKAHPALPSYRGHVLMDNRHALIVDCRVTQAVPTRRPSVPTRTTTPGALSPRCATSASRRTSLRTPAAPVVPPSTGAPPATRATASRSTPAAASRRCLAGSSSGATCSGRRWRRYEQRIAQWFGQKAAIRETQRSRSLRFRRSEPLNR